MQQHIDGRRQQYREDQGDGDGALWVFHFAGHRNDRRQAQVGKDHPACRHGHLDARQAERCKAMHLEVLRLEEGEQHADHQQRHDELEYAHQVIGDGKGLHAAVIEHKEQAQQGKLHQPAQGGGVAGAGLGQLWKPGCRILTRGDHFNRHQAGKRDQRDKAHQVAQQRAMGIHRVAHHAASAG